MVSSTCVLPEALTGQDAGLIAIWASVIVGSSVVAASRTAVRAATGLFCSAMTRTPSRAAADSVPCTWKAWPNSAMPSTSTTSSGTMKANSTALAPRSSRSRIFMSHHLPGVQRRSGPPGGRPLRRNSRDSTQWVPISRRRC
jgi:hypothetical protein